MNFLKLTSDANVSTTDPLEVVVNPIDKPGLVGDTITLAWRDDTHAMTVAEAGRIMNVDRGDLDGARRLFATPGLGLLARRTLATRISRGAAGDSGLHVERVFLPDDVPDVSL